MDDQKWQIIELPNGEEVEFPADMNDADIMAAISGMGDMGDMGGDEPSEPPAPKQSAVEANVGSESPLPPGLLTTAAAPLITAQHTTRPAIARVGKTMSRMKRLPGWIGGTVGATTGGTLGAAIGGPGAAMGGGTLGAAMGHHVAKTKVTPVINKAGKAIEGAFSKTMPRTATGGFARLPAGRAMVNAVTRKLPYVGAALTAVDIANLLYNNSDAISSNIQKSIGGDEPATNPQVSSPARSNGVTDEDLMREILARAGVQ